MRGLRPRRFSMTRGSRRPPIRVPPMCPSRRPMRECPCPSSRPFCPLRPAPMPAPPRFEASTDTSSALRGLNKQEALTEISQIGDAVRAYYAPLQYKQTKFGFNLDAALDAAKSEINAGTTEADFIRPFYRLLAKLKDGHVS